MPAYRRSAVVPYLYDAAWETANVIVSQALVVGRGVYRDESGSRCSSINIETAATPARPNGRHDRGNHGGLRISSHELGETREDVAIVRSKANPIASTKACHVRPGDIVKDERTAIRHTGPRATARRLRRALRPHDPRECLDLLLILGRRHLEHVLRTRRVRSLRVGVLEEGRDRSRGSCDNDHGP